MTDDLVGLNEGFEALSGEHIAALQAVGEARGPETGITWEMGTSLDGTQPGTGRVKEVAKTSEPRVAGRNLGV